MKDSLSTAQGSRSLLYIFAVLICGTLCLTSLLTPFVYSALEYFLGKVPWPFSRVYNRVAMVVTTIFIYFLRREFRPREVLALYAGVDIGKRVMLVLCGLLISCAGFLLFLPLIVREGVLVPRASAWAGISSSLASILLAAILVPLIEESFFLGVVFQRLKRTVSWLSSAVISSIFFAVVHFIRPVGEFEYNTFSVLAGFNYLFVIAQRVVHIDVASAAFGLTLAGLVLCYALRLTGTLYLCIGIHMGWIIALKLSSHFYSVADPDLVEVIGRRFFLLAQLEGWCAIVFVMVVLLVLRKPLGRVAGRLQTAA